MVKWGFLSVVGVVFGLGACGTDGQVQSSSLPQGSDSGIRSGGAPGAGGPGSGGMTNGGVAGSGGAPTGGAAGSGETSAGGAAGSGGAPSGGITGSGGEGTAGGGGAGGAANNAVALYVLFDETLSMTCQTPMGSRIQNAKDGFTAFLQSPAEDGVGLGIQFWMIGGTPPSCAAADYAKPEVEIAPLSGNRTAIGTAIAARTPSSMTGPGPVLQGGADHAASWATAHPGRKVAVVLVADGTLASVCKDTDPVAVARAAFIGAPSVRTYVLGLVDGMTTTCSLDPSPATAADFDPIAVAGGTNAAYIAKVGTDGAKAVTDALTAIALAAAR